MASRLNSNAQSFVIDSLYSENGILRIPVHSALLNSEIVELEDGEFFVAGSEFKQIFASGGVIQLNKIGLFNIASCGVHDSTYGINGRISDNDNYSFIEEYLFNDDQSAYLIGFKQASLFGEGITEWRY